MRLRPQPIPIIQHRVPQNLRDEAVDRVVDARVWLPEELDGDGLPDAEEGDEGVAGKSEGAGGAEREEEFLVGLVGVGLVAGGLGDEVAAF